MRRPRASMGAKAAAAPVLLVAALTIAIMAPAQARILGVEHLDGLPGRLIDAPDQVFDDAVASVTHVLGFDERQNVRLERVLEVDDGKSIPPGAVVSSHMLLFNLPDGAAGAWSRTRWTFDGPILGVMSDHGGRLEAASTPVLGAPGTAYPAAGFRYRGIEDQDGYEGVGTSTLTLTLRVWQPGDWIRVVTGVLPVARIATPDAQAVSMMPSAR